MIAVENIPDEILCDLDDFAEWFFAQDRTGFKIREFDVAREEAVSLEYLAKQQSRNTEGFPACSQGIDFNEMYGFDVEKFYPRVSEIDGAIRAFLGARSCAIKMYYPAGGFIDWHTNANAFGYNVLFTYSREGDGAFMYQNPKTKEVVSIPDKKGWNMKIGVYDKHDGLPLWHAAHTNCERLTWGYILDEIGWQNLVEELDIDMTPLDAMYDGLPQFRKLKSGHAPSQPVN